LGAVEDEDITGIVVTVFLVIALGASAGSTAVSGILDHGSATSIHEVFSYASFLASTAMMDLPYVPSDYYNFAISLRWVNFLLFVPFEASGGRRLTNNEKSTVELFCVSVGIPPTLLFIYTLLGFFVIYICFMACFGVIVALRSLKARRLSKLGKSDMILRFSKELAVRLVYYGSYPLAIVTVYEFYLNGTDDADSGMNEENLIYLTIAAIMVVLFAIWFYFGVVSTNQFQQLEVDKSDRFYAYRCLVLDWKLNRRYFWIAKVITVWTRALFLGSIRRPSPIQAAMFLASAIIYMLLLLVCLPYQHMLQNRIALLVALAYTLNTALLLVFATTSVEGAGWGQVQIILSMVVVLGSALICTATKVRETMKKENVNEKKKTDDDQGDVFSLMRLGCVRCFKKKSEKEVPLFQVLQTASGSLVEDQGSVASFPVVSEHVDLEGSLSLDGNKQAFDCEGIINLQ